VPHVFECVVLMTSPDGGAFRVAFNEFVASLVCIVTLRVG
jgi:hypothetical protein